MCVCFTANSLHNLLSSGKKKAVATPEKGQAGEGEEKEEEKTMKTSSSGGEVL